MRLASVILPLIARLEPFPEIIINTITGITTRPSLGLELNGCPHCNIINFGIKLSVNLFQKLKHILPQPGEWGAGVLKLAHSHTDDLLFLNFYDEYRLQMVNVKAASDNGLPATWWAIPC